MKISLIGLDIKEFEQFRSRAYRPVNRGRWTIGYGNTFYADVERVKEGDTITKLEAESLLKSIISKFESQLQCLLEVQVSQNQFDALLSFMYNIGPGAFASSTLRKVVNKNPRNFKEVGRQMLRWNKSGGRVYRGLIHRRKAEFNLYSS